NNDEQTHAITGLYFADLIRDLPLAHLRSYTTLWYAHYPNLGILVWPPLFHIEEAVFFLLFGPTAVVARLAVLLFALCGLAFWFRLVDELVRPARPRGGLYCAIAATFVLAILPHMLLFEQAAMLEIPLMALAIAAIFYWLRYLRSGAPRPLYWFAFFAALTILTKQNCVFIPVYCLLTLAFEKKLRCVASRAMLTAAAIVAVLAGPYLVVSYKLAHGFLNTDLSHGMSFARLATYYRYLRILPDQLTWPVVVLSLFGLLTWRWWARARGQAIEASRMALWIAAVYLTFLAIPHKESRYVLYWAPAFVFFAVVPLVIWVQSRALRIKRLAVPVLAAFLLTMAVFGWRFQRPSISGYRPLARAVLALPPAADAGPRLVVYDGPFFGNFIFYMRALDPARHWIVMRKLLYVTDVEPAWGYRALVHSPADVRRALARYGIRYIVVGNGSDLLPPQRDLRTVLRHPPYRLLRTFPIHANTAANRGIVLSLYENPDAAPPTARNLVLPMMSISHNIVIPMNRLNFRQPLTPKP
ncbi:MAG: glycosyltransferase family 39 protein, partial [Terriglobales bacterium]